MLDWDTNSRSERIDVIDASTGAVMNSQTVSSFNGGEYLTWTLSGDVQLRFTLLAGANAVLSGIFFNGAGTPMGTSATFVGTDATTQGNWSPTYGTAGYDVIGGQASLPSYATVSANGQSSYVWAATTGDVRAPQVAPGSTGRVAASWYGNSFTVDVDLTDGQAHEVSLYLLDWDTNGGRSERIDVLDAASGKVLDSETASSFSGGEYLTWTISGDVEFRVTNLPGSSNAVLSGLFFELIVRPRDGRIENPVGGDIPSFSAICPLAGGTAGLFVASSPGFGARLAQS